MNIDFTKFTESLSTALDFAEKALLGVAPMHGMRVAVLTNKMARCAGFSEEEIYAVTQAAALHDCALSEYFQDEMADDHSEMDMSAHCSAGETILRNLPLYGPAEGAVLYHHERADGKGAFGLKAEETPLCAQLIHIADVVDVTFSLFTYDAEKYDKILTRVREGEGSVFSGKCAEVFLASIDGKTLESIAGEGVRREFKALLPDRMTDVSMNTLREMSSVFATITDYKSHFTWRHSMGIAEKAETMGKYYGRSGEECDKLFVAGALHDVGKLITSNEILDKPDKLTSEEYKEIQNHAMGTWELLHDIGGLEDITRWAAFHHEKLDGSGYPFGLTGDKLDGNSRLLACLDIYQALVEDRPYKKGMSHEEAVNILKKLGNAGKLDTGMISDIDACFGIKV